MLVALLIIPIVLFINITVYKRFIVVLIFEKKIKNEHASIVDADGAIVRGTILVYFSCGTLTARFISTVM